MVIMCVILGFPVALILAWAFELTPDGIKTTKAAQEETEVSESHAKKRGWLFHESSIGLDGVDSSPMAGF